MKFALVKFVVVPPAVSAPWSRCFAPFKAKSPNSPSCRPSAHRPSPSIQPSGRGPAGPQLVKNAPPLRAVRTAGSNAARSCRLSRPGRTTTILGSMAARSPQTRHIGRGWSDTDHDYRPRVSFPRFVSRASLPRHIRARRSCRTPRCPARGGMMRTIVTRSPRQAFNKQSARRSRSGPARKTSKAVGKEKSRMFCWSGALFSCVFPIAFARDWCSGPFLFAVGVRDQPRRQDCNQPPRVESSAQSGRVENITVDMSGRHGVRGSACPAGPSMRESLGNRASRLILSRIRRAAASGLTPLSESRFH